MKVNNKSDVKNDIDKLLQDLHCETMATAPLLKKDLDKICAQAQKINDLTQDDLERIKTSLSMRIFNIEDKLALSEEKCSHDRFSKASSIGTLAKRRFNREEEISQYKAEKEILSKVQDKIFACLDADETSLLIEELKASIVGQPLKKENIELVVQLSQSTAHMSTENIQQFENYVRTRIRHIDALLVSVHPKLQSSKPSKTRGIQTLPKGHFERAKKISLYEEEKGLLTKIAGEIERGKGSSSSVFSPS